KRTYLLTGTPISSNKNNIVTICELMAGGNGDTSMIKRIYDMYGEDLEGFASTMRVHGILRRVKTEVDLPDKVVCHEYVELSNKKEYDHADEQYAKYCDGLVEDEQGSLFAVRARHLA